MHTMLHGKPLRFFIDHVVNAVKTAEEAFDMIQVQYNISAHRDRYIQKFNCLKYRIF